MLDIDTVKKNLGKKVKKLRLECKISQEKLAEKLDLDTQTITSIEIGRSLPSGKVLVKLANFFNVDPGYLFKINELIEYSENSSEIKEDIIRMLSDLDSEKLKYVHNFICALRS